MSSKSNDSAWYAASVEVDNHMTSDELFDWKLYGATIRNRRTKMGYKTAEAFSKTIWRRTRVLIPTPSIYKIEQGKQIPDAMQFMALNIAVSCEPYPKKVLYGCVSDEWEYITDRQEIPQSWKRNNTFAAMASGEAHVSEIVTTEGSTYEECTDFPDDEALFSINKAPSDASIIF